MANFTVKIKRTETYSAEVDVEADSQEEANKTIQDALSNEGWDSVCDNDGEYDECFSEVEVANETPTITIEATDENELFHAFKSRGSSPTKRKVGAFLRELDQLKGRTTPADYWYASEGESN